MKNIYVDLLDAYRYIESKILLDNFYTRYDEASDIVDACVGCIIKHALLRRMMGNWPNNYMECAFNEVTVGIPLEDIKSYEKHHCIMFDTEVWRLVVDCLKIEPKHPYMIFYIGDGIWRIFTKDFTYA